jgi:hypothetical protein
MRLARHVANRPMGDTASYIPLFEEKARDHLGDLSVDENILLK